MDSEIVEYIGYTASFFVVVSFVLKDLKKIRIMNLIGCIFFVLYGIYKDMLWPIMIPNAVLFFIQIYHLLKKEERNIISSKNRLLENENPRQRF